MAMISSLPAVKELAGEITRLEICLSYSYCNTSSTAETTAFCPSALLHRYVMLLT